MSFYGWQPYVPVGERQNQAEKAAAKAKKEGKTYAPIAAYRGAVAKTVWGKAWCDNLAAYSNYANRLPRGASYVRNGSVIDLQLSAGKVTALVMGSSLYAVSVTVKPVEPKRWSSVCKDCAGSVASLVEILQGKLSSAVMQRICQPGEGLMPSPNDIRFDCSCPDWADVCKHVAAVLYGIGARLDTQPELLFTLRHVDAKDLVQAAGAGLASTQKAPKTARVLDDALLDDVFGLEMAQMAQMPDAAERASPRVKKAVSKKVAVKKVAATAPVVKKAGPQKTAATKIAAKTAAKKVTAKKSTPGVPGKPKPTSRSTSTSARLATTVNMLKKQPR